MPQTIVITGATSGIGAVAATRFAALGWHVFACGLPGEAAPNLPNVVSVALDITDDASVQSLLSVVQVHTDGILGLVNNAGIQVPSPLEALPVSALQRQLDVNVLGHLRVIQALLPLLRVGHGRIVNVSSVMGEVAMPMLGAYSMSKHALEAMSDTLRLELDVPVSLIQMGAVQTPMTRGMHTLIGQMRATLSLAMAQRYAALCDQMQAALVRQSKSAIPPEAVVDAMLRALTDRQPTARYRVDTATKGLSLMRRLAPEAISDAILKWSLGIKKPQ